jgi:hypothetical protein
MLWRYISVHAIIDTNNEKEAKKFNRELKKKSFSSFIIFFRDFHYKTFYGGNLHRAVVS